MKQEKEKLEKGRKHLKAKYDTTKELEQEFSDLEDLSNFYARIAKKTQKQIEKMDKRMEEIAKKGVKGHGTKKEQGRSEKKE